MNNVSEKLANGKSYAFMVGYAFLAALFFLGVFLLNKDAFRSISNQFTLFSLVGSVSICMAIFVVSGVETAYLARVQTGKQVDCFDTLTLSVAGAFWGYLLPVKGGVAYLFFLMKKKYGIRFAQGAGLIMVSYVLTSVLAGCAGLWYFARTQPLSFVGIGVSALFVLSPGVLYAFRRGISGRRSQPSNLVFCVLLAAIDDMMQIMTSSFFQWRIIGVLLALQFARIGFRWAWYAFLLSSLGIGASFGHVLALTFVAEIANIFTVIPGNIGINEGLAAVVFSIFGGNMAHGVLIEIAIRISALILAFTVGLWAVVHNAKNFEIKNLRSLRDKVSREVRMIFR